MGTVLREASLTGCPGGGQRRADVLHVQEETYSKHVPQDTCPGEVPENKGLWSLGFRKFALCCIHFMKIHSTN